MAPIELIKGSSRQTVYSEPKADALVADGWQRVRDLPPEQQRELADLPPSPWNGYEDMRVEEVLERAKGLPPEQIKQIVTYESATKGRVSVVNKLTGNNASQAQVEEQPPVTVETVKEGELQTVETVEIVATEDASATRKRGVPRGTTSE